MISRISCSCGREHGVTEQQAGLVLHCTCGAELVVPPLSKLRGGAEQPPSSKTVTVSALNVIDDQIADRPLMNYVNELIRTITQFLDSCAAANTGEPYQVRLDVALRPRLSPLIDAYVHSAWPATVRLELLQVVEQLPVPAVLGSTVAFSVLIETDWGQHLLPPLPGPFASLSEGSLTQHAPATLGNSPTTVVAQAAGHEPWLTSVDDLHRILEQLAASATSSGGSSHNNGERAPSATALRFGRLAQWWAQLGPILLTWLRVRRVAPRQSSSGRRNASTDLPLDASLGPFAGQPLAEIQEWVDQSALDEITEVAAAHPTSLALQEMVIRRLIQSDQLDRALEVAEGAVTAAGEHPFSHELRGMVYQCRDELQASLRDYERALELDPQRAFCWGQRGRILHELGGYEAAEASFTRAIELFPQEPEAWLDRAKSRLAGRKLEAAFQDICLAIYVDPHIPTPYAVRADIRDQMTPSPAAWQANLADFSHMLRLVPDNVDGLIFRAELYCRLNKFQSAVEDCERVLQAFPDNMFALGLRGFAEQQLGNFAAAKLLTTRAIELGLKSPMVFLSRAICYFSDNTLDSALADLDVALELDPEYAPAYNYRGMLHASEGNWELARADFAAAARFAPDWSVPVLQLARVMEEVDSPEVALQTYAHAIELNPHDCEARFHYARTLVYADRLDEGQTELDAILGIDPEFGAAYVLYAELCLRRSDFPGALLQLDQAANLQPDNPSVFHLRARVLLHLNRLEDALRDFNHLVQILPNSPGALMLRSEALYQSGSYEAAEQDVDEAIRLAPEHVGELQLLRLLAEARAANRLEDYSTAVDKTSEILALHPDHTEARHLRAASLWYDDSFVEALEDYDVLKEACETEEQRCSLLNSCGQLRSELGEYDEALTELDAAVILARQFPDRSLLAYALNGRGRAYAGLTQFDAAERDFEESRELSPDNGWLYYNVGLMRAAQGRTDEATTAFQQALDATTPPLTPRKRARAQRFIGSPPEPPPQSEATGHP